MRHEAEFLSSKVISEAEAGIVQGGFLPLFNTHLLP